MTLSSSLLFNGRSRAASGTQTGGSYFALAVSGCCLCCCRRDDDDDDYNDKVGKQLSQTTERNPFALCILCFVRVFNTYSAVD